MKLRRSCLGSARASRAGDGALAIANFSKGTGTNLAGDKVHCGKSQCGDIAILREGRALFVHRCIECHTLPAFWRYSVEDWPDIVNSMSHRANLKPAEREAIVAYILAVRAQ